MRRELDPERSTVTVHASSSIHPITTDAPVTGWLDVPLDADGRLVAGAPVDGQVEVALGSMRAGNPLIDREAERRLHVRRYPTVVGRLTALSPATTPAPDGDGDGDDQGRGGADDGSDHDGGEHGGQSTKGSGQSTKGGGESAKGGGGGDNRGAAFAGEGTLDFHGVTRPLHGELRLTEGADGALTLRGTAALDVTDFGVQPPSLLLVKVHPRIRVELSAVALAPEA